jgi:putative ABC transport system ATP-binding protein
MNRELLRVEALSFARGAAGGENGFGLHIDSLRLSAGTALGLTGPSGCGKSTLIDLLALLRRPATVERFDFAGHDIAELWKRKGADACAGVRARHIGVVLQTGGLLPSLPVWDNVTLSQQLLGAPDRAWAAELLKMLDLTALERRLPAQLSIGQRQRVAIARALAHRPELVLADEPTAALGPDHAHAALELLLMLTKEAGAALIVVSHDVALLRAHDVPLIQCVGKDGVTRLESGSCARPGYASVN